MVPPRTSIVAIVVFSAIGIAKPEIDVFQKLIPEFIFCFNIVNLRTNQELVDIMYDFPTHVKSRQQKCFLRCLLRRHKVFLDPFGSLWSWENAYAFLMSFGYSAGREPYVKSSLFYCVRKKKMLLSKYGCKNAYNFFKCLTRHGMSFRGDFEFWKMRLQYLKDHPYVPDKGMSLVNAADENTTDLYPSLKERPNASLSHLFYDVDPGNDTDYDSTDEGDDFGYTEEQTELVTEVVTDYTDEERDEDETEEDKIDNDDEGDSGKNDDDGKNKDSDGNVNDDASNNENANDDTYYDNPLKITASEPYRVDQSLTPRAYHLQPRFSSNDQQKTIIMDLPDIASKAHSLNLKWVDMTND